MTAFWTIVTQIVAAVIAALVKGFQQEEATQAATKAQQDLGAATSINKGQADDLARAKVAANARTAAHGMSDDDLDKWL